MNVKNLKAIGIATSIIGCATTLLGGWVDEQKMKDEVAKQVAEQLAKMKQ